MNINSIEKWFNDNLGGNNFILVFLMILIVIVIIDCNTKMFSKMVEGNSGNGNGQYKCGGGYTGEIIKNPTGSAKQNCNVGSTNKGVANANANANKNNSNNNNNNANANANAKSVPVGYDEDEVLFASATKPLGVTVPRTMQQDYSVLSGFTSSR